MKKIILIGAILLNLSGCQNQPALKEIGQNGSVNLLSPTINEAISSPVEITGEARGTWFFEGTFPISIVDWDGLIIGEGYATAQANWMTEEFIPFTAQVEFTKPTLYDYGAIILKKDNPSGLPEFDDALEISIRFK